MTDADTDADGGEHRYIVHELRLEGADYGQPDTRIFFMQREGVERTHWQLMGPTETPVDILLRLGLLDRSRQPFAPEVLSSDDFAAIARTCTQVA